MLKQLSLTLTLALLGAAGCDHSPDAPAEPPRITLSPQSLTVLPSAIGTVIPVRATVTGFGPAPAVRWRSANPASVVVDAVQEGGAVALLRVVASRAGLVIVEVTGTVTLADTLAITIPAAAAEP